MIKGKVNSSKDRRWVGREEKFYYYHLRSLKLSSDNLQGITDYKYLNQSSLIFFLILFSFLSELIWESVPDLWSVILISGMDVW